MRILLLRTLDAGHLYSLNVRGLCHALQAHGQHADIFDFTHNPDGFADHLIDGRYDTAISFGSLMGGLAVAGGRSVFEAVGARFVGWHFDHPIYMIHNTSNAIAGRRTIHANRNHLRFAQSAALPGAHTVLLPGSDPYLAPIKDYGNRQTDVFLAATWNGEPQRPWEALEDTPVKRIILHVIDRLLSERETSVLDAFHQACGELGYGAVKLDEHAFELLRASLNYVRHRDRLDIVKSVAEAGLRLTLCGSGWESTLGDRPNVRLLPSGTYADTRRLYGDAKISINLNAGNGACERAVNAMMAGSCVVSDFSSALSESFGPGEIRFFDRRGQHGVAQVISNLLESGQAEPIAAQGQARAAETMLWRHRVDPLLAFIS